jgi:hypothetical protein
LLPCCLHACSNAARYYRLLRKQLEPKDRKSPSERQRSRRLFHGARDPIVLVILGNVNVRNISNRGRVCAHFGMPAKKSDQKSNHTWTEQLELLRLGQAPERQVQDYEYPSPQGQGKDVSAMTLPGVGAATEDSWKEFSVFTLPGRHSTRQGPNKRRSCAEASK